MALLRFSRGSGIGAFIVRTATWSEWAHVGFLLDDGMVLDACPGFGVSIRKAEDDESVEYWDICAPKKSIADAVEWAKTQIGKPYDWRAITGFVTHRDWHDDRAWFCSELVEAAMDSVHWPLLHDSNRYDRITPRDLMMSTRIRAALPSQMPQ